MTGRLTLATWLREGLRAGLLLRPRLAGEQPTPAQLFILLVLATAIELGLGRFEVNGPAHFDARAWLGPSWSTAAVLLLAWWVLTPADRAPQIGRPSGLAAWFALWVVALLPSSVVSLGLSIAQTHETLPAALVNSSWLPWAIYALLWGWVLAVGVRLSRAFGASARRCSGLAAGLLLVFGISTWQFPDRPWQADESLAAGAGPQRLQLSQEVFEAQQAVWASSVKALAPERPGVIDVYGLVFAPYADEDVFLRESTMVNQVLADRFDAAGRVLQLVNHASTAQALPWATPANLERAINAISDRMDRENDVLVVYLTSHGASNFQLAATHGPLQVDAMSPGELRAALDKAGIRHRVIAVSACYAGGWVGPLASPDTLVMTAADESHTSYGCGRLSELTFFGRAVFDEQLRTTRSFEQAFAAAVPVIKQREIEGNKPDGFSNPQISVGEKIRPVLQALAQRLDARP